MNSFLSRHPSATRFDAVACLRNEGGLPIEVTERHLLQEFSKLSKERIKKLTVSPALAKLREKDERRWALVSATEVNDLREIVLDLQIERFFQAGIFGSPLSKKENILSLLTASDLSSTESVLLGDRLSDKIAAEQTGADFIFVSGWSDASPEDLKELKGCPSVNSLSGLLTTSGR